MGDTPINLASPEDRSKLLFSRGVKNKKTWAQTFNLGYEVRGNTRKPKRRTPMSDAQFKRAVASNVIVQYRTEATRCNVCNGYGRVSRKRKDGTWGKARYICKSCGGVGIKYMPTNEVAGFKLAPISVMSCSTQGFKTDADALSLYRERGNEQAFIFIERYLRFNAIKTYLKTFVEGIEKNLDYSDRIHPQFMQCVTSTGRLSSRSPNFQNMPRGKTFPVRRAVVSRFEGGHILEGDYAQLEYRVAGYLSQDKHVYENVKGGVDVLAGVIDSGYRGEVQVCLLNTSNEDWVEIKEGDRIAQILFQEVPEFRLQEVDVLQNSDRGQGGFGSSGK